MVGKGWAMLGTPTLKHNSEHNWVQSRSIREPLYIGWLLVQLSGDVFGSCVPRLFGKNLVVLMQQQSRYLTAALKRSFPPWNSFQENLEPHTQNEIHGCDCRTIFCTRIKKPSESAYGKLQQKSWIQIWPVLLITHQLKRMDESVRIWIVNFVIEWPNRTPVVTQFFKKLLLVLNCEIFENFVRSIHDVMVRKWVWTGNEEITVAWLAFCLIE